jgi:transposase
VRRFPTKNHFVAHTGTAALEASSAQVIRDRLSRAGGRSLNHTLYLVTIVEIRHPTAAQPSYHHKRAERKSSRKPCAT